MRGVYCDFHGVLRKLLLNATGQAKRLESATEITHTASTLVVLHEFATSKVLDLLFEDPSMNAMRKSRTGSCWIFYVLLRLD